MTAKRELLTGWGGTPSSSADVVSPTNADEIHKLISSRPTRGLIARGLGRSYGDAALSAGGVVVDMTKLNSVVSFDESSGVVDAEAGLSLDALMRVAVPRGWFVPVTPGTRYVTIGGAIAADIHGKNHHVDGSFGDFVESLDLMKADGDVLQVTPTDQPEIFWATIGGMGLTGLILSARLRLIPVETSMIKMDEERANNIDELMEKMIEGDHKYRYSVAWIDSMATGKSLGRGVLTRGDHATTFDVDRPAKEFDPSVVGRVPLAVPGLLNKLTVRAFNTLWFQKSSRKKKTKIVSLSHFFHPLDGVGDWNLLYGDRGFLQYQFVIPDGSEKVLRSIIGDISKRGFPSFLSVLKRFGSGHGYLSFPQAGWTLALDIPVGYAGLAEFLDELDQRVADEGGRIYLAKDSRLRPDLLEKMYPQIHEYRSIRNKLDPDGLFVSDLSRRLGLT